MTYFDDSGVPVKIESSGLALEGGAGYDIPLSPKLSITAFGQYLLTTDAGAQVNGADAHESLDSSLLQFGLGMTWH